MFEILLSIDWKEENAHGVAKSFGKYMAQRNSVPVAYFQGVRIGEGRSSWIGRDQFILNDQDDWKAIVAIRQGRDLPVHMLSANIGVREYATYMYKRNKK